ncbi:hypothetical protein [Alphaproteobacteria bacterium endosymbiont of Tiliacea citrago]|uniref:hypothetical protein n=1 Tax=Alphaproteobacteria bacterium endosymbiont of Tiliacea citrago TaxID=3077944 RepID=UPI00313EDC72
MFSPCKIVDAPRQNKLTRLLNSLKKISFPNEEGSLEVIYLQDYITSLPIGHKFTNNLEKYYTALKTQSSENKIKFFKYKIYVYTRTPLSIEYDGIKPTRKKNIY